MKSITYKTFQNTRTRCWVLFPPALILAAYMLFGAFGKHITLPYWVWQGLWVDIVWYILAYAVIMWADYRRDVERDKEALRY